MSLPTAGSHFISLQTAIDMTDLYRSEKENILDAAYRHQGILALSETFNRAAIDALLNEQGCAGIRIYYGMDEGLKVHAILVAVDENNADILPTQVAMLQGGDKVIVEEGQRCPDICPPGSVLNQ